MEENLSNVMVIENNSIDSDYSILSDISFSISLFTFIFVVYFLYVFLRDIFIRR